MMKVSKATIRKIIKEEIAKVIKEKYQPNSDDPPHKVNKIRIQELQTKVGRNSTEIDQLFDLLTEHVLTPKGIAISRAVK